jgi:hypothetical protein
MAEYVVEFGRTGKPPEADGRLDSPSFHRNHGPIWSVLAPHLADATGDALEIGSGTGQHVVTFAAQTPGLTWWPSDPNDNHCRSIEAWRRHAGLANVRAPLRLDMSAADWRRDQPPDLPASFRAIVCINVLHIAPWSVTEGLLQCAAAALPSDGRLFVYGPFMRDGRHTAPSNAAFDESLRRGNPEWGVRDTAAIGEAARVRGLRLADIVEMPANNFVLVVTRG